MPTISEKDSYHIDRQTSTESEAEEIVAMETKQNRDGIAESLVEYAASQTGPRPGGDNGPQVSDNSRQSGNSDDESALVSRFRPWVTSTTNGINSNSNLNSNNDDDSNGRAGNRNSSAVNNNSNDASSSSSSSSGRRRNPKRKHQDNNGDDSHDNSSDGSSSNNDNSSDGSSSRSRILRNSNGSKRRNLRNSNGSKKRNSIGGGPCVPPSGTKGRDKSAVNKKERERMRDLTNRFNILRDLVFEHQDGTTKQHCKKETLDAAIAAIQHQASTIAALRQEVHELRRKLPLPSQPSYYPSPSHPLDLFTGRSQPPSLQPLHQHLSSAKPRSHQPLHQHLSSALPPYSLHPLQHSLPSQGPGPMGLQTHYTGAIIFGSTSGVLGGHPRPAGLHIVPAAAGLFSGIHSVPPPLVPPGVAGQTLPPAPQLGSPWLSSSASNPRQ